MSQEVTIAGEVFSIEPRYAEGHILNANEASALNQTFFENVRNNMAKAVAEAVEAGAFDKDEFQGRVAQYATEYEFGARRGRVVKDPVMALAFKDCKKALVAALNAKYGKDHSYSTEAINEKTDELLASPKGQRFIDSAREKIEIEKKAAADILGEDAEKAA